MFHRLIVMSENEIKFFKNKPISIDIGEEPTTCTDAEPFALRVLDDSMEPEFTSGCIIIVDPTGRATDGCYVLAEISDDMLFRQLRQNTNGWSLVPLNKRYPSTDTAADLGQIAGVVVQRAGARRSYHKSYEKTFKSPD